MYYVELDDNNRPYRVMRKVLMGPSEASDTIIFVDDDPTHYIDIAVSKDRKCLFINSGTKEDSEVWVIPFVNDKHESEFQPGMLTPKLLLSRTPDVRVHIEHIRNFFLIISNNDKRNKNYRL